MNVVIIPGFMGHPDEVTFRELEKYLVSKGHSVTKIAWPYFPNDMHKYSFTNTLRHCRKILNNMKSDQLVLLGFSMGGIIATVLSAEFTPNKLGLIVSPYLAGSEDDLAGKYKEWKEIGKRQVTSSKYGELIVPFSFIKDAQKYNALEFISKVHCPKLFIVGEQDDKVPAKTSRKLFMTAKEPKQWFEVPKMEHKYQYQNQQILQKVNDIIVRFVESNS